MRPVRVCLAAVLLLLSGGAVSCATDAYAQGEVTVTPYRVQRGDPVQVSTGACRGDFASANSEAFEAPVNLRPENFGGLTGRGKIKWSAQPGTYPVWVDCDGGKRVARGQVVVEQRHQRPEHWKNNWHHQPWSPVTAGGGGTAKKTDTTQAQAQEENGSVPALPLALVGGGAAVLALGFVRRRTRTTASGDPDAGTREGR
ncbi:hypothetical protein OG946_11785 [Streptomyces sp. NBC_01808]|uniref:hypothetical protein n=1 Tax=Streptomyces sp. NBC_01808 TaxID=2975947 RepID=UPI002DDAD8F1|nr:hypothetical protein [Streptomyces sp. NBC_01808]WSA37998.1 hypothetical protein OG946_11785 [Streptomyces sp. NBC_01808]